MKRLAKKRANSFVQGQGEVKRKLNHVFVTRLAGLAGPPQGSLGRLQAGSLVLRCALGRAGIRRAKQEGDHSTPAGHFLLLSGYFRADKTMRRAWPLPLRPLRPNDGWCDDPASAAYNRHVTLPCRAGHEKLWRKDNLYDLVIVLDYNIHPCRKGRGSAIFLHCARPDLAPTEGCVALRPDDLRRLLPRLARNAVLTVR